MSELAGPSSPQGQREEVEAESQPVPNNEPMELPAHGEPLNKDELMTNPQAILIELVVTTEASTRSLPTNRGL